MSGDPDRKIDGEVTRVAGVSYLQGASGHAVGTILSGAVALLFLSTGRLAVAWVAIFAALLLAGNGLSIYAWDTLRVRFEVAAEEADPGPERTLTAHRLSAETAAEMKASLVMVVALLAVLFVGFEVLRWFGPQTAALLYVAAIVAGSLAALAWSRMRSSATAG